MGKPITVPNTFATQSGPIPLSQLDADFNTAYAAINDTATYSNYFVDSSPAANAITVTTTAGLTFAYNPGTQLLVKLANTNTSGTVTVNVNGLGAVPLTNSDGTALMPFQLVANQLLPMAYATTGFRLLNPQPNFASNAVFTGSGAIVSLNTTVARGSGNDWIQFNDPSGVKGYVGYVGGTDDFFINNVLSTIQLQTNNLTRMEVFLDGGVTIGAPTGGDKGLATLNVANGLYVAGNSIFAGFPANVQTGNYGLVASDAGKQIIKSGAGAATWTIPDNSSVPYPIGTVIMFTASNGVGVVTLSPVTDQLVLVPSGATGSRTLTPPFLVWAIKITATNWLVGGFGIT